MFGCIATAMVLNLIGEKPIDLWKTTRCVSQLLLPHPAPLFLASRELVVVPKNTPQSCQSAFGDFLLVDVRKWCWCGRCLRCAVGIDEECGRPLSCPRNGPNCGRMPAVNELLIIAFFTHIFHSSCAQAQSSTEPPYPRAAATANLTSIPPPPVRKI